MRTKAKFYVLLVYKGFQKKGKLSLEYRSGVPGIIPVGPFDYLMRAFGVGASFEFPRAAGCPSQLPHTRPVTVKRPRVPVLEAAKGYVATPSNVR